MYRQYFHHLKPAKLPSDRTDFWFTANRENAAHWPTKEEADSECMLFNRANIEVSSPEGLTHRCGDFKSEERKPAEIVVFCETPFIPRP
jgi:hypothetical protein